MDYQAFKGAVTAAAENAGLEEYELYYSSSESMQADIFKTEVRSFSSSVDGGACFRCIVGGKMGYASTEYFSAEEAEKLVEKALDNAASIESSDEVFLHTAGDVYQETTIRAETQLPVAKELITKALDCQKALYQADQRVIDGTETSVQSVIEAVNICNSKGLDLSRRSSTTVAVATAVVKDGEELLNSFVTDMGSLPQIDINNLAEKAVEEVLSDIGAGTVPSGTYKVVFSGKMMATLLHTFSSVFFAEEAQRGLSLLKDREKEAVASAAVTIVDDPFYPGSGRQQAFDAEGVAAYTKNVVEDGVLNTLLYHLGSAHKAGVKSSGNAFKAGYSSNVSTSPFYFYVKPGQEDKEKLFAEAGEGVYITMMQGMHSGADPRTGDFSLASGGFLIQDGKKGRPVKGFTVAGNFFELLKNVSLVGSDLEFNIPQGAVYGSPGILVDKLSIAGE